MICKPSLNLVIRVYRKREKIEPMYLWLTMILRVYQGYARIVQNIEGQYLDTILEKILDTRQYGFLYESIIEGA